MSFRPNSLIAIVSVAMMACQAEKSAESASGTPMAGNASVAASDDSLLDLLPPGKTALTATGDTLSRIGGAAVHGKSGYEYFVDEYWKNGTRYLRVQRSLGQNPGGSPKLSTRSRIVLPRMGPSETLKLPGFCRIKGARDPFLLAVVSSQGGSVQMDVSYAWRLDPSSETLRAISTTGVTCFD
jgi:hypothetical protein